MKWETIVVAALMLASFLIGCATASRSVPPATAAVTTKWGYHCLEYTFAPSIDRLTRDLDAAGAQGWQLVTTNGGTVFCMTRQL